MGANRLGWRGRVDASGLDREIDRPIGLLADDEDRQVAQSAMVAVVNLVLGAFVQLTAAICRTEARKVVIGEARALDLGDLRARHNPRHPFQYRRTRPCTCSSQSTSAHAGPVAASVSPSGCLDGS
jgi:hypothetical protein